MSLPARKIRPRPSYSGALRAITSGAALAFLLLTPRAQAQPRMTASIAPDTVRAGEPLQLSVEVRWTGTSDRFILYPPRLNLPPSVKQGALTQHFETLGPETIYHYEYTLTPDSPGELALGKISLDYRELGHSSSSPGANPAPASKSATEPAVTPATEAATEATAKPATGTSSTPATEPSGKSATEPASKPDTESAARPEVLPGTKPDPVVEEAPTVKVLPGGARGTIGRFMLPGGGIAIVLLALGIRRRRLRPRSAQESSSLETTPLELLEEARRALTAGRQDEVYALLIKLKPALPASEDPLPSQEQLEAERLRARYGGGSSPRGELERLVRAVEVALKPARHETCKD